MKKKLFIVFSFIATLGFTQTIPNSFKISNNSHPEKESFYIASIEKANMESYRLQDKAVVIKFENGFECELLSAKQLFLNGVSINATSYKLSFEPDYVLPSFNVLESGQLIAIYPTKIKQSKSVKHSKAIINK